MKKAAIYSGIVAAGLVLGWALAWPQLVARFSPRERVTPGQYNDTFEAGGIANYERAVQYCKGKTVADMASGSGYGTKLLLDGGAKSVDGYDYKPLGQKYVMDFEKQSWSKHYDVIVSFETIEHLANPDFFLSDVQRTADLLILSTPFGEKPGNEFHKQFWTLPELKRLVDSRFTCRYQYTKPSTFGKAELGIYDEPQGEYGGIFAVCKPRL